MRLIDADALIAEMHNVILEDGEDRRIFYEVIERQPSVQPEQRWIPVTERLPDKPDMYTVTDSKGDVVRFVFYDNESSRNYWRRCAKAWMPLPEPFREEKP